jgi:hypothetical protein
MLIFVKLLYTLRELQANLQNIISSEKDGLRIPLKVLGAGVRLEVDRSF